MIEIQRCIFEDNRYDENDESYYSFGGTLAAYEDPTDECDEPSALVIADSLFENNFARQGGAFICYRTISCDVTNSHFEGNATSASGRGGVLEFEVAGGLYSDPPGNLSISECSFVDNEANNGGVVHVELAGSGGVTMSGCTFENNIAGYSGGVLEGSIAGELRIEDCEFLGQQVGFGGGALDISGEGPTVSIERCWFEANESVYNGTVRLSPDHASITISESSFVSNPDRAIKFSGDGGTLDVVDTVFEDNYQAINVDAGMGNAPPSTATMQDCTIFRSTSYGAALGSGSALVTLESIDSDWGDGADDNVAGDIYVSPFGVYTMPAPPANVACTTIAGCS